MTTSESCPNTSAMSLRNRRAAAPVSSSASTTMPPLTRCSESANRSIEETSDFRQQVLVTAVLASSAFTCAVIAMRATLERFGYACISTAKFLGIVLARMARHRDVGEHQSSADPTCCRLQAVRVGDGGRIGQDGVYGQVRGGAVEYGEVVLGSPAVGLPR